MEENREERLARASVEGVQVNSCPTRIELRNGIAGVALGRRQLEDFVERTIGVYKKEAAPMVVELAQQGADMKIASRVMTLIATPETVLSICSFLEFDKVLKDLDRTASRNLLGVLEGQADSVPPQHKESVLGYLKNAAEKLGDLYFGFSAEPRNQRVFGADFYRVVRVLLRIDPSLTDYFEKMLIARYPPFEDLEFQQALSDLVDGAKAGKKLTDGDFSVPFAESELPFNYDEKDWKRELTRIVRRAAIWRKILSCRGFSEMKQAVRDFEEQLGTKDIIDDLVTNEASIDPKMAEVARDVFMIVSERSPKVKAVVLLGSSVHGGARVRGITASREEPDLDWGVITDGVMDSEEAEQLTSYIEFELENDTFQRRHGLSSLFHSCGGVNPRGYRAPALIDKSDARGAVERLNLTRIALYLSPSFPPEINEENRKLLREALFEIKSESEDRWLSVVAKILGKWKDLHGLKDKHFESSRFFRDMLLKERVVDKSSDVMSRPMKRFLGLEGDKPESE